MPRNSDPIDDLIAKFEPRLREAFLKAISDITNRIAVANIERLLKAGDINGAVEAVGLNPLDFRDLSGGITEAFNEGGRAFEDAIPARRSPFTSSILQFQFDVRNPVAEAWTRDHSAQLVTGIIDDQKAAIRDFLTTGLMQGRNPTATARDLVGRTNRTTGKREGGIIGLTAGQQQWQERYGAELAANTPEGLRNALTRGLRNKRYDSVIRKAIETGKPIPADMQRAMVAAYRNRSLKYRADVISRNETMRALGASQTETYRQAIASGNVLVEAITRFWQTAGDERVRHAHRLIPGMNKQGRGWEEPFDTPTGPSLHAPHDKDVGCRCRERIRLNYALGVR
jgi:hypothetical protein